MALTVVSPMGIAKRKIVLFGVAVAVFLSSCACAATSDLTITEFLASNNNGLRDEDGASSDWIEIHNGGNDTVNLAGLHLTDDLDDPTKWTFPSFDLAADGYLVVFASGEDRTAASQFHTNFRLGAGGEYLGLYDSDGTTVISEYRPEYPAQSEDVSYGINSNGDQTFFSTPSPGQANGVGDLPVAGAVVASMDRGFYEEPFRVMLLAAEPGMDVRYTLDGSEPTADSGFLYRWSAPIEVSTTTVLRAAAFSANFRPSPTSTYSYVFLEAVIAQPATIPGFPNGLIWQSRRFLQLVQPDDDGVVPQDFAMDPEIVADYSDEIIDSMRSIPSMMLTANTDDIFSADGFYFTDDIEKVASMEILDAIDPSKNEQIDVGVEAHAKNRNKRALRLNFRTEYGNREWITEFFRDNVPVNKDSVITDTHRTLILRSGSNRSWARSIGSANGEEYDKVSYTIDEFYRSSQVAMTGVGSHGTFVHLYLNGVYWGLYNLAERPDEQFQAAYNGGDDDDYFFTTPSGAGNADSTRWDYLKGPLAAKDMGDPTNYAELQEYLNVERFADYMILNFYVGMTDWPSNNWFVANRNDVSPLGATPSEFFSWDGEYSLDRRTVRDRLDPFDDVAGSDGAFIQFEFKNNVNGEQAPPIIRLWHACFDSSEFRALLDERVAKHTGAGGALTADAAVQRWNTLNEFIESAVIGESARWGDSLQSLGGIFGITRTRDVHWRNHVEKIRSLLEGNTQQFLDEYSDLVSPKFLTKIFRFTYGRKPGLFDLLPDRLLAWLGIIPPRGVEPP